MAAHEPAGVPFTLYALRGRVLASNVRGKLVDLGQLAQEGDGSWSYRLDGDQSTGSALGSADEALDHIARTTTFLFMDGQFTALEDLGGAGRPDLAAAAQRAVLLKPGVL
ncbi:VCBS domain-containing protein [Paracidovorax sp. MALMAid1276]|uniref:VCBS domain-containing protein n=1 Tax=Paracidovorax sp. MALMAid1276 TaxID=3411631 RepID=UPI003B9910BF